MTELSNQYPRLEWTAERDATRSSSYLARPHDGAWARIYLQRVNLDGEWWLWTVHWPGRFSHEGMRHDKQAAADAATIAYWDAMEETAGWEPAPSKPLPTPPQLPAMMIGINVRRWLASATRRQAKDRLGRYMKAAIHGPTISGDRQMDRWIWMMLTDAWQRLPD